MDTPDNGSAAAAMRSLVLPVYLPWLASGLGAGVLLPALPLYLREEGLSFTAVSVVLAASGVGAALGSLPAGSAGQRIGEDRLLGVALAVMAITAAMLGVTTAVVALVAFRVLYGMGQVALGQSRQTFITRTVAVSLRGRVMSSVGGTFRLSLLIGPLVGGVVVDRFGFVAAFMLGGALTAAGLLALVAHGRSVAGDASGGVVAATDRVDLRTGLREHRRRLLVVGVGPALVMAARDGRHVVVPLIADSFELSPSAVGALVAVGTGADLLLFPVAGYVMDRFGRLHAMVPAFSLMSVGLLLLGLADSATTVVLATVVVGMGNGMSAGTLLTYGSDLAPRDDPGPFLAGLNVMTNSGRVVGPLIVGWSADAIGLDASAVALAVVLAVAVAWLSLVVGETADPTAVTTA